MSTHARLGDSTSALQRVEVSHLSFLCKIAGHVWKDGRCRRCGEAHAEHKWEHIPGQCALRCSVCGRIKETAHEWKPIAGKCKQKCAVCGKESIVAHTWERFVCVSKCSVCGAEGESHLWANHRCSVCGVYDQAVRDLMNASYADVNSLANAALLNSLSQETLAEITTKAKCGLVCHAAKARVYEPVLLAQIMEESDNEFIVNEIKKKFICSHCGTTIDAATLSLCKCNACGNELHDFYKIEDTQIDSADFTCGTYYEKCKRCNKETERKSFSHYSDGG